MQHTFRLWWQKPRKVSEIEESREVSFLELFYDLIFVWIFAQLTHALVDHLGTIELLWFIGLFAMVWFAWINGSFYHELHGNFDLRTRVFTFLQIFTLFGLAIFAHNASGEGANAFALSYAAFLGIVGFMWWRTGVHDQAHRPMSNPYSLSFLVATALFVGSVFVAAPVKFYLWIAAMALLLFLPFLVQQTWGRVDPEHLEQAQRLRPSIIERFGLLTIIVLGEVMNSIVSGGAKYTLFTPELFFKLAFGFIIVVALWWIYFDMVARRAVKDSQTSRWSWIYLHLPVTITIALTSAGLLNILAHPESFGSFDRWLIAAPVSAFLFTIVLLVKTIVIREENKPIHEKATQVSLLAGLAVLAVGASTLSVLPTLGLIGLFLMAPVMAAIIVWIRRIHRRQHEND